MGVIHVYTGTNKNPPPTKQSEKSDWNPLPFVQIYKMKKNKQKWSENVVNI